MSKPKSKRKTASYGKSDKIKSRGTARTTARKTVKHKPTTKSTTVQQLRPSSQQKERSESKQARIIAMLRAPAGTTIDAMAHATGWQPNSVRGFLAGVVRKKLGLTLVSADGESGRIYRIITPSAVA